MCPPNYRSSAAPVHLSLDFNLTLFFALPVELYAKFINANRIEGEDRMWSLKRLVSKYSDNIRRNK